MQRCLFCIMFCYYIALSLVAVNCVAEFVRPELSFSVQCNRAEDQLTLTVVLPFYVNYSASVPLYRKRCDTCSIDGKIHCLQSFPCLKNSTLVEKSSLIINWDLYHLMSGYCDKQQEYMITYHNYSDHMWIMHRNNKYKKMRDKDCACTDHSPTVVLIRRSYTNSTTPDELYFWVSPPPLLCQHLTTLYVSIGGLSQYGKILPRRDLGYLTKSMLLKYRYFFWKVVDSYNILNTEFFRRKNALFFQWCDTFYNCINYLSGLTSTAIYTNLNVSFLEKKDLQICADTVDNTADTCDKYYQKTCIPNLYYKTVTVTQDSVTLQEVEIKSNYITLSALVLIPLFIGLVFVCYKMKYTYMIKILARCFNPRPFSYEDKPGYLLVDLSTGNLSALTIRNNLMSKLKKSGILSCDYKIDIITDIAEINDKKGDYDHIFFVINESHQEEWLTHNLLNIDLIPSLHETWKYEVLILDSSESQSGFCHSKFKVFRMPTEDAVERISSKIKKHLKDMMQWNSRCNNMLLKTA